MDSIGILIYGELEFNDIISMLDSVSKSKFIDYSKYELVIRQIDLETRQKYGNWSSQTLSNYIRTLSPNIYNLFLDRPDLSTPEDQKRSLLNYIKSVNGLLIVLKDTDYIISQSELDIIHSINSIIIDKRLKAV